MGNNKEFARLIKLAIGNMRTQAEFANEAGISAEHLNRLMNLDNEKKPRDRTLEKIADASEGRVDLRTLRNLFEDTNVKKEDYQTKNRKIVESVEEGLIKFGREGIKYKNLCDLLDNVNLIYAEVPISYSIDEHDMDEYEGKKINTAENYAWVTVSWADSDTACEMAAVVFYSRTAKGGYIVTDVAFDLKTVCDFGHPVGMEVLTQYMEEEDVVLGNIREVYTTRILNRRLLVNSLDMLLEILGITEDDILPMYEDFKMKQAEKEFSERDNKENTEE